MNSSLIELPEFSFSYFPSIIKLLFKHLKQLVIPLESIWRDSKVLSLENKMR